MYHGSRRLIMTLSVHWHRAVLFTILLVPVVVEGFRGWQKTGICLSCVNWVVLALYLIVYLIAVLLIASATRQDKERVEEEIRRRTSKLTRRIDQLSEDHQEQVTRIQDYAKVVHHWARDTKGILNDELGLDLPPLPVSAWANIRSGESTVSAEGTASSPAGLLNWVKCQARNLQRWAQKTFVGVKKV